MDYILKEIIVNYAEEPCRINMELLHESLLCLPADKYLTLFKLMSEELGKLSPTPRGNL